MKLKHLLSVAALALPATMMGAPAYPGVLTHTNPDGTTVEYRLNGDEFFSYITNAEGTTIMERNVKGLRELKFYMICQIEQFQLFCRRTIL